MSRAKYAPIDPVLLGTTTACPADPGYRVYSAVIGDNSDLMLAATSLWVGEDDVVMDVTFGDGTFWNKTHLPQITHDLFKLDGVDCRQLPEGDESVDVVVIDTPYRPTHGSKSTVNGFSELYGIGTQALDSINDVLDLYAGALKEAYRVCRPKGRVMVKCQDMSYNHRLHLVTLDVLDEMFGAGFEFADQFILAQENATGPKPAKHRRQERAGRSHSVLWVGVKA